MQNFSHLLYPSNEDVRVFKNMFTQRIVYPPQEQGLKEAPTLCTIVFEPRAVHPRRQEERE